MIQRAGSGDLKFHRHFGNIRCRWSLACLWRTTVRIIAHCFPFTSACTQHSLRASIRCFSALFPWDLAQCTAHSEPWHAFVKWINESQQSPSVEDVAERGAVRGQGIQGRGWWAKQQQVRARKCWRCRVHRRSCRLNCSLSTRSEENSLLWWWKGRGLTTAHQGSGSCTRREIRPVGIRRV